MKLIYRQLFFSLFIFLSYSSANAATRIEGAQCLPNLGEGNICSAKDFTLTSAVISGPASCTEGEIVGQPINVRLGLTPTANSRYDIGIFIGENGESPIQGESCTFSSLSPVESGGNFDGLSGSGPYRDLDNNTCGGAEKSDGEIFHDIVLNNVLCVDSDNDGQLDVDYALTWQNQARLSCSPSNPEDFTPPSSSKCKAAIGNIDIPVVPPVSEPSIKIIKSASPHILVEPGGDVTYSLEITNDGTQAVTLTALHDNVFGDVTDVSSGITYCSVPQSFEPHGVYKCKFIQTISGTSPGVHTNIVTATAEDGQGNIVTASDNAEVLFIAIGQPSASIGDLIWNDLNADGFHTDDEPGIEGVLVNLFQNNGDVYTLISSTTSLTDGYYEFDRLSAGTYRVIADVSKPPLSHMIQTGGINPHEDFDLAKDEHYKDADFGYSKAAISVTKIADHHVVTAPSGSVTYTVNTTNSAAVDVTLTQLYDNVFGDLLARGCSLPQSLAPGASYSCQFTETITGNSGDTHTNTVTALAFDKDQNEVHASDSARIEFIDTSSGSIGHFIWNDLDADQVYDPGEPFFDDVTLALTDTAAGTVLATTITANGGQYTFAHLPAGNYTVIVTDTGNILSKHILTTLNEPLDVVLSIGQIYKDADFGYVKALLAISKTADKSIVISGTDVDFTLLVNNAGVVDLEVTHLVDNKFGVLDTECALPVTLAAGAVFPCTVSRNISGSNGIHHNIVEVMAHDSDNNTFFASDEENVVIVSGGAIGYLVWFDANDNGSRDDNEPGIEGVTIDLRQNGIIINSTTSDAEGHYYFLTANGTYEVVVTDAAHILDKAELSSGSENPRTTTINDAIDRSINFGYKISAPLPSPHISVTKTGSTSTINGSEQVTFYISVHNTSIENVILTELHDTAFGSLDGKGSCSTGGSIAPDGIYHCSFSQLLTGSNGDKHFNIVYAISKDRQQKIALGADSWLINFITQQAEKIPGLSIWGLFLLISFVLFVVYRKNKAVKNS